MHMDAKARQLKLIIDYIIVSQKSGDQFKEFKYRIIQPCSGAPIPEFSITECRKHQQTTTDAKVKIPK